MRRVIAICAVALMVAACSSGSSGDTTTTDGVTTTTVQSASTTQSSSGGRATTTLGSTSTTEPEIDVTVADGVVDGPDQFEFNQGDVVSIWVLSDVTDEIHVHGYDMGFDAEADVPIEVTFTATVTGIFEVELESSSTLLFELVVSP
jgi:hypothetical protein